MRLPGQPSALRALSKGLPPTPAWKRPGRPADAPGAGHRGPDKSSEVEPALGTRPARQQSPWPHPSPHAKGSQNIPALPGRCQASAEPHTGTLSQGTGAGRRGGRRQPSLQGLQAFPEPLTPLPPFHRQLTKAEMGLSRDTGRLAATQGHMAGQAPARCGVTCWDSPLRSHANSQNPHVTQRPPALTRPG